MKMQFAYGIYEGEIEPVLTAVRLHRPLAEIEATPCPCCGAKLVVEFSRAGDGFEVSCGGKPPHLSTHQEITNPPPWWRERVWESSPITFYWWEWSSFAEDGTLTMKVSGYEADGCHWSGAMELRPDQPDYQFWKWIIDQGHRYKSLINDKDLQTIRQEYNRIIERTAEPDRPCE